MRVIIEIQNGARAGHKILLREQEVVVFGRSEWSDVAVKQDARMGNRHFSLHAQNGQVQLRDLGTDSGTLVNQQLVDTAWLEHGDVIRAGNTQFVAWIAQGNEDPQPLRGAAGQRNGRSSAALPPPWSGPIAYRRAACESGLVRIRGGRLGDAQQPPAPAALAGVLAQLRPLTLLIDPQLSPSPAPQELAGAVSLYDWRPLTAEPPYPPLIVPRAALSDAGSVLDESWDHNAVVSIFSRRPAEALVAQLQSAVRRTVSADADDDFEAPSPAAAAAGKTAPAATPPTAPHAAGEPARAASPPAAPSSLLGICWPAVLAPLLTYSPPSFVERLFDGLDAVLLEVPDRPQHWQLWCPPEFLAELAKADFHEVPAAPKP